MWLCWFYVMVVLYMVWGVVDVLLFVCLGGVVNIVMCFSFLVVDFSVDFCVVCMDWFGCG